jgi:hypothetical protein
MKAEEMRVKIAEFAGLTRLEPLRRMTRTGKFADDGVRLVYCSSHVGGASEWEDVPDFTGDLNACHEAEKHLYTTRPDMWSDYVAELERFTGSLSAIHAAAPQRCEALIRALNI